MNKHLSLLPAALLLTGASSVFAASSTDLTVTGTITPTACIPSLINGGIVDYGKISKSELDPNNHSELETKKIPLTVTCDSAAQFAIKTIDNRPNTADWPNRFGLGLINGTEKLGNYALGFLDPVGDMTVTGVASNDQGQTWSRLSGIGTALPTSWIAFGNQAAGVWTPEFLQNLTVDVVLYTYIVGTKHLTLTDEVNLDGSATLQIEYL